MGCRPLHATAASSPWFPFRHSGKKRVDESMSLTLDRNRNSLIRQEDSIIFSLLERAQYSYNTDAYNHDALLKDGLHGSLVEYMVWETEKLHAQMGRYKSPDPAYFPEPILPPLQYPQALSKRIHYGKFVAEAKFQEAPSVYEAAIRVKDRKQLLELLTYETVEAAVKKRVKMKARTYGQVIKINEKGDVADPVYKIKPSLVANLYGDWIMPLTKEGQVEYLLRRLE